MTPDEVTNDGGEGQGQCDPPGVKLCPLPRGNATEFPFPLSIHGAWMLAAGIREFGRQAGRMHESGEDASYCLLMTLTAIDQAVKLRDWAVRAAPDYLEGTIRELGELLAELADQRDRFKALAGGEGPVRWQANLNDPAGTMRQRCVSGRDLYTNRCCRPCVRRRAVPSPRHRSECPQARSPAP